TSIQYLLRGINKVFEKILGDASYSGQNFDLLDQVLAKIDKKIFKGFLKDMEQIFPEAKEYLQSLLPSTRKDKSEDDTTSEHTQI
ncbi:MAG: hypothetical protein MHPSP_003587, partial [Paramarteilia canceri]